MGTMYPDTAFVKLRYTDLVLISWDTNSIPGLARYAINSPFDPQVSGGGTYNTQPYGYDQYSAVYGSYRCAGSSISLHALPFTTASVSEQQIRLTCFPTPVASTSVTDIQMFRQIPYTRSKVGTFYDGVVIKNHITVRKLAGISRATFQGDGGYSAVVGSDPVLQAYWMVSAQNFSQTTGTPAGCYVAVSITYYVQFFNRKLVASS